MTDQTYPATDAPQPAPPALAARPYGSPRSSAEIGELATALSKAQGEMSPAGKDSKNPHFGSKYASLAAVIEAIRAPFFKHGLSIIQLSVIGDARVVCRTRLMHASGQWIECDFPCMMGDNKNPMQGLGSAWTYARRYSLMAMVGVAPDDEDDGQAVGNVPHTRQAAQGAARKPQTAQKAKPAAKAAPKKEASEGASDPEKAKKAKELQGELGAIVADFKGCEDIGSLNDVMIKAGNILAIADRELPKTAARVREVFQEEKARIEKAEAAPDGVDDPDSIYGEGETDETT